MLPHFERAESAAVGQPGLAVAHPTEGHPWSADFAAAAAAVGFTENPDFNDHGAFGFGYYPVSRTSVGRRSAVEGFLAHAIGRPNLTVRTGCEAQRLITDHGRVVGVTVREGGAARTAFAGREVILAAGAVASPVLLLRSGIGPADELRRLGLDVFADLPGVGANLHDHFAVSVAYRSTRTDPVASRAGLSEVGVFANADGAQLSGPDALPAVHAWLAPGTAEDGRSFGLGWASRNRTAAAG